MNPAFLIVPLLLAATGLVTAANSDSGNAYVERVIDGDTVVLGDGSRVRLIGIDTPEADEPCGQRATEKMRRLVEHRVVTVSNPDSVQETDRFGRQLRYLDTDTDPAAALLADGLAIARYDSTDGYQAHPRQSRYHLLEAAAVPVCPTLDRSSRWYSDPGGYRKHVKDQRLAREERERQARIDRRRERRERQEARSEETLRELIELGNEALDSNTDGGVGDDYAGPRCYAPGGKTWGPC